MSPPPVEAVAYFTKYVGNAVETDASGSNGGRWGFWRKDSLPGARKVEGTGADKVAADLNRITRKVRRKRADAARYAALARKLGFNPFRTGPRQPAPLSLWDLERLRAGYSRTGFDPYESGVYLRIIGRHAEEWGFRPAIRHVGNGGTSGPRWRSIEKTNLGKD